MIKKRFVAAPNLSFAASQVVGAVRDYVLSRFPRGYFRSVVALSSDEAAVARETDGRGAAEFLRETPTLAYSPAFSLEQAVNQTPSGDHAMRVRAWAGARHLSDLRGSYPTVFADDRADRYVLAFLEKRRFQVDFALRVESEIAAWDALAILSASVDMDSFFFLNRVPLSSVLPNAVAWPLCMEYGLDPRDPDGRAEFLTLLRLHSGMDFRDVLDPARGTSYFAHAWQQNLVLKFAVPTSSKTRKGRSNWSGAVTFSAEVSVTLPSSYGYDCRGLSDDKVEMVEDVRASELSPSVAFEITSAVVPPESIGDLRRVAIRGFVTDAPDRVDLEVPVLGEEELLGAAALPQESSGHAGWEGDLRSSPLVPGPDGTPSLSIPRVGAHTSLPVDLGPAGTENLISLQVACTRSRGRLDVAVGGRTACAILTAPGVVQTSSLRLVSRGRAERISVVPATDGVEFFLWGASVRRRLGTRLSTETSDVVRLAGHLGRAVEAVIADNIGRGVDNSEFFRIVVSQKGGKMVSGEDVSMDWGTLDLTITSPLFNTTHYVALYADPDAYAERREALGV